MSYFCLGGKCCLYLKDILLVSLNIKYIQAVSQKNKISQNLNILHFCFCSETTTSIRIDFANRVYMPLRRNITYRKCQLQFKNSGADSNDFFKKINLISLFLVCFLNISFFLRHANKQTNMQKSHFWEYVHFLNIQEGEVRRARVLDINVQPKQKSGCNILPITMPKDLLRKQNIH